MRILAILAAFAITMAVILWLGARLSLDRSLAHRRAAARLPAFDGRPADGLIAISARGMPSDE